MIFHFDDASIGLDCMACSSKDEATFKSTSVDGTRAFPSTAEKNDSRGNIFPS